MFSFEREILGHLASMKNSRGFNGQTRRSFKKKAALQFEEDCLRQLGGGRAPFPGRVVVVARINYGHPLSDLEPALLMDCLQKANVIANDRQVVGIGVWKDATDKVRPRVWFKVEEDCPESPASQALRAIVFQN